MKSTIRNFLVVALTLQCGLGINHVSAATNQIVALCNKAEKALQGKGLSQAELAEAQDTIRSQCAMAKLFPLASYSIDSGRACNDITYEIKHRWRISSRIRSVLLGVLAEDCPSAAFRAVK